MGDEILRLQKRRKRRIDKTQPRHENTLRPSPSAGEGRDKICGCGLTRFLPGYPAVILASYLANDGPAAANSATPATHATPPETTDTWVPNAAATDPASTSPSLG